MTMTRNLSGAEALRIMAEEIGLVIGSRRLQELDRKVRAKMAEQGKSQTGTGREWIAAIARVIVDDDDTKADEGFRNGLARIRRAARG